MRVIYKGTQLGNASATIRAIVENYDAKPFKIRKGVLLCKGFVLNVP